MTEPASPHAPPQSLAEVTHGMRRIHEGLVAEALATTDVAGTCFYSAILLKVAVEQFTPFAAQVRGGGDGDGGYLDFEGRLRGHYWVAAWPKAEVASGAPPPQETWVLDITSDQFGGPPVAMVPLEFAGRRYIAGSQQLVDEHVAMHGAGVEAMAAGV